MDAGNQLNDVLEALKLKNQLISSINGDYSVSSFCIDMEDKKYTISTYLEIAPNWKDSGIKGDYLNNIIVTDKENNKIAELSSMLVKNSSYIFTPKNAVELINFELLTQKIEELPLISKDSQHQNRVEHIQNVKENIAPKSNLNSSFKPN